MDDEFQSVRLAQTDLQETRGLIGANQHREIVEAQHTYWMLVSVENVGVGNAVLPGTPQDDWIHFIKLS